MSGPSHSPNRLAPPSHPPILHPPAHVVSTRSSRSALSRSHSTRLHIKRTGDPHHTHAPCRCHTHIISRQQTGPTSTRHALLPPRDAPGPPPLLQLSASHRPAQSRSSPPTLLTCMLNNEKTCSKMQGSHWLSYVANKHPTTGHHSPQTLNPTPTQTRKPPSHQANQIPPRPQPYRRHNRPN